MECHKSICDMKPTFGFSLPELMILLCASGILFFLAIPFLRSFEIFPLKEEEPYQPIHPIGFSDSNISTTSIEDKDLNHSFQIEVED